MWGHAHEAFSWRTPAKDDETHPNSVGALADFSRHWRAQPELSASVISRPFHPQMNSTAGIYCWILT